MKTFGTFLFPALLIAICLRVDASNLQQGITITNSNRTNLLYESDAYSSARIAHRARPNEYVVAFLSVGGNVWSLSGKPSVAQTRIADDVVLKYWVLGGDLASTQAYTVMAGELQQAAEVLDNAGVYAPMYWEVTDPSLPITGTDMGFYDLPSFGCLDRSPLRYGDMDGDGQNDLVVFDDAKIFISSPERGEVIFAAFLMTADEVEADIAEEISGEGEDRFLGFAYDKLGDEAPQFIAGSGTDQYALEVFPALRAFAKLYFGDFDGDESRDLVMWRKLYESNTVGDSQPGFHKKGELLVHYELVEGKYLLQDAEQSTVRGWLSANELTWQDGFPSKSECPGHEDELIPEMHDPLLNDPEVLK